MSRFPHFLDICNAHTLLLNLYLSLLLTFTFMRIASRTLLCKLLTPYLDQTALID